MLEEPLKLPVHEEARFCVKEYKQSCIIWVYDTARWNTFQSYQHGCHKDQHSSGNGFFITLSRQVHELSILIISYGLA